MPSRNEDCYSTSWKNTCQVLAMADFILYIWPPFSPMKTRQQDSRVLPANVQLLLFCICFKQDTVSGCVYSKTSISSLSTPYGVHSILASPQSSHSGSSPHRGKLLQPSTAAEAYVLRDFQCYNSCFQSKQCHSWHDLVTRRTWLGSSTLPSKY